MDNFAEQLVSRKQTSADRTKAIATMVGGGLLTIVLVIASLLMIGSPVAAFFGLILAAAAGYGTYFLIQNTQVEYEYTFTNGTLDIDKIIAKKKRLEMLSVEIGKFTAFGKYDDSMADNETEDMTVVTASDNIASGEYYADFPHDEYGSTRLIFSPDERILGCIRQSLPRQLRNSQ
ncbi:MAG: hypothetical protein IJ874_02940 [Ruminococcus sp.]|nr:hypothetical protein [Ruminococcus sp.]